MEKHYRFAGIELTVSIPDDACCDDERFLAVFRTETVRNPHHFEFELVEALIPPEGSPIIKQPGCLVFCESSRQIRYFGVENDPNIRAVYDGKKHKVQVKKSQYAQSISARTVLNAIALEHLVARNDGFVFHCSYIDRDGEAILFTAPSETGKSTQADLWHQYRGAEIINGDRATICLADGRLLAEGIPFAGSSKHCKNRSLPIRAIVYLGQAPKTSIRKMRGYEAFSKIWEGVSVNTWDREDMERVSAVVQKVAEQIPVYHLPCTPDESAVIALEEVLRKQVCV